MLTFYESSITIVKFFTFTSLISLLIVIIVVFLDVIILDNTLTNTVEDRFENSTIIMTWLVIVKKT